MEQPESTSAKFKLGRWLLLMSVVTVALGGFVWWKSQSERLQFVETIWSDSLVGHENTAATGQRRKIGEVWSVSRSCFGREFEGRYPVFVPGNAFHDEVSDRLLGEFREGAAYVSSSEWEQWLERVKSPVATAWKVKWSFKLLFVSESALSIRQFFSHIEDDGVIDGSHPRNFVDQDGTAHKVELKELFRDTDWQSVISDFCLMDLQRQGTSFIGAKWKSEETRKSRMSLLTTHLSQDAFAITPAGLRWCFPPYMVEPNSGVEFEVFIPFEKLADHLRPNGPHRLFQTKANK